MSGKLNNFVGILGPIAVLASVVALVAYLSFIRQLVGEASQLACSGNLRGEIRRAVFIVPYGYSYRVIVLDTPQETAWLSASLAAPEPAAERPWRYHALISMRGGAMLAMLVEFLKWGHHRIVIFQPCATVPLKTTCLRPRKSIATET